MGEHAVNPKDCTHGDGVIAVTTFLVKPVILRRLGPVNDGSNVHLSPGHSNWLEELCMRLTLLSRMLPRFARLMSSRTRRRDAVRAHFAGREFRPTSTR